MVTNDFRAHRVCRFVVTEDGAGYASRQEVEVIKSNHVAFRPIDAKMGPDGAIYIADWYNPIIQHGEVDFRDPRRDHTHGRIWRVSAKGRSATPRHDLSNATDVKLLKLMGEPEEWTRLHAKLLLKARGERVLPLVDRLAESITDESDEANHLRLELLWLYESMNKRRIPFLLEALGSNDHRVRAAAMRVATYWRDSLDNAHDVFARAASDDHPRVRLEAVRALSLIPSAEAAASALVVLDQPMDRFLDFALWQCMRDLQDHWLRLAKSGKFEFGGNIDHLTFALKSVDSPDVATPLVRLLETTELSSDRRREILALVASLGGPKELGLAFEWLVRAKAPAENKAEWLSQLISASQAKKTIPNTDLNAAARKLADDNLALQDALLRAAGAWRIGLLRKRVDESVRSSEASTRRAAIESLGAYGDANAGALLLKVASGKNWGDRRNAITALASFQPGKAAAIAATAIVDAPNEVELTALLRPIIQRKGGPIALTKRLASSRLDSDQAKLAIRAVRSLGSPSQPLIEAFKKAGKLESAGWKLTPELVQSLTREVLAQADPHRGEMIFRRAQLQCLKCHAIGGAGGRVGPDLLSLGATAQVDYLIESMIDPNAKVKENYHSIIVQTDSGKVLTGVPVRQSDTEVVIRDAEDKEVIIPADTIEARKEAPSLMPKGAVDQLTRDELRDLVGFLAQLGKVGDFSVGKEPVVRTWRLLTPTPEALHRIRRTSFDTAATDDPAFEWQSAYSRVGGGLPVGDLAHFNAPTYVTRKDSVKTVFVRASFVVTQPGRVVLNFGDVAGLQLWLEGKPTPAAKAVSTEWAKGEHSVTIAIDKLKRASSPIRVQLDEANSTAQVQVLNGK